MTSVARCALEARMMLLSEATAFVEQFCLMQGIGHDDIQRLRLVVEELFTNTVEHGHGADCDAPIRLELSAGAGEVVLEYEDDAPPFDAVAHLDEHPPDTELAPPDRPVGGLGLGLIARLATHLCYERRANCNRLRVVLRLRN